MSLSRDQPASSSRDQPVPSLGDNYVTIKKRVGGGFKYVKVKVADSAGATKKQDDREKQDYEEKEKADTTNEEEEGQISADESFASMRLPLSSADLRREDTCEGKVRYEDHPILRYIQDNVIGNNLSMTGPFGKKKVVYCDYTASGRSLTFIEDYIRQYVCPFYANTHSETGINARQTAKFREEARSIIRRCVNAGKDDVVIFTGSGATAGMHKVAWGLKVNQPRVAEETVVLTGPYEHHSNILLWKECGATLVRIRAGNDGNIDTGHLASELKFWKDKRRHILVCVSAASNVTGIVTDTDEVARIAHQYGAFVLFDYAGGGPYLKIDMNPSKQSYKDVVFLSPHKFVGGPGSPGVVIAKRWVFKSPVPDRVGGGTVVFVSRDSHSYTSDIEAREEGGTPAIIESIRTGLAFQLKEAVGEELIAVRDEVLCCRAFSVWEKNPHLVILGSHTAERVTIFSFVVNHVETGKFVHYNFISTLLNDLFGIQSRGGCACAGPYGLDLLGISEPMAKRLMWFVSEQPGMDSMCPQKPVPVMRPGFCRVNLPYFYDDETVDYVIKAVDMVATHGWKLLPQYTFNPYSGTFVYKGDASGEREEELYSLADIDFSDRGRCHVNRHPPQLTSDITLQQMMSQAEAILEDTRELKKVRHSSASVRLQDLIPKDKQKLRWFLTPQEANDFMTGSKKVKRFKPFMTPRQEVPRSDADFGLDTFRSDDFDPMDTIKSNDSKTSVTTINTNKRRVGDKKGKYPENTGSNQHIPKMDRPRKSNKLNDSVDETRLTETSDIQTLDFQKNSTVIIKKGDTKNRRKQTELTPLKHVDDSEIAGKYSFGTSRWKQGNVVLPKVQR